MAIFKSRYGIDDYVEFLEKPTDKKPKSGRILDVSFSDSKISYTIVGGITKKGSVWVYGGIEDKDIINKYKRKLIMTKLLKDKNIEIPNPPRLITDGGDDWFDYLANGYILWGLIIIVGIIGISIKYLWLKSFIKGICG